MFLCTFASCFDLTTHPWSSRSAEAAAIVQDTRQEKTRPARMLTFSRKKKSCDEFRRRKCRVAGLLRRGVEQRSVHRLPKSVRARRMQISPSRARSLYTEYSDFRGWHRSSHRPPRCIWGDPGWRWCGPAEITDAPPCPAAIRLYIHGGDV